MSDWLADLPTYDLHASEASLNELYASARSAGGLGNVGGYFAAFRHDQVKALLAHRSVVPRIVDPSVELSPYVRSRLDEHMLNRNGADHVRLRRLVSREFTPGAVARHEARVLHVIDELIALIDADKPCDFMAVFANRLPIMVICDILGMPRDEGEGLLDAVDRSGRFFDRLRAQEHMPEVESGYRDLEAYFDAFFSRPIDDMPDGLLRNLRSIEMEGDRLTHQELMMWAQLLFRGGLGNTRHQIGSLIHLLARSPDQWSRIREEPALARRAVEECMRVEPAVHSILRQVREEFEFEGWRLAVGTGIMCVTASANRDEHAYPRAAEFDVTRDPAPGHLLFGGGPHLCPGNLLVKSEVALALQRLTSAFSAVELAGEPVFKPALQVNGPDSLPVVFRA
ncbi:cytochrome P450 hydroxylase [Acrocarpospora pleiomorpha]|uniref:Cytochrome P450 hydroxylase n=1 Tax=Acrocarpospora pleiomorpha TaxID=90975 RepID=A0A5M3Y1B6_9ACTN|nr:cytochrome P450 [Acrocarpospora pleiomorpha]GES27074.1 cytochrome P450 hydroxylase [Acrocarpospora pleiomorpha]